MGLSNTSSTVTLEALIEDLDETISYLRQIYPNQKLILLGHSRGSLLGLEYIKKHGTKVDAYVGMGQLIHFKAGLKKTMDYCASLANEGDMRKLEALKTYAESTSPEDLKKACIGLEQMQTKYKIAGFQGGMLKLLKIVSHSPVFRLSDLIPIFSTMKNNINLFPCVGGCDFRALTTFPIPVYWICGRNDWQAPGEVVAAYDQTIIAPRKGVYWIENAGHFTDLDQPEACIKVLNEICLSFQAD